MSLPLPTLTWYRLPDVSVGVASIAGLLDAILSALNSTTDYRGTALPTSHQYVWARHQNGGTTDAVYTTAVPSGPGVSPRIAFAGAASGSPAMASPDSFTASGLLVGVNKNSGAYNTAGQGWDQALPFTSGQFSGYYRAAGISANAVTTVVRAYVSQEAVFLDIIVGATTHYWILAGAILEPWTDDTLPSSLVSETDNRLYGMVVVGGGSAVANTFLNTSGGGAFFTFGNPSGDPHACVLQPNTSGRYNIETTCMWKQAAASQQADLSGRHVAQVVDMCIGGSGASIGRLREVYRYGLGQGGKTVRNGATDILHIVGCSSSFTDDAIALRAAA